MMKNVLQFTLKVYFVLKIFKFLSRHFLHVEKCLIKVDPKIFDEVIKIKKQRKSDNEI